MRYKFTTEAQAREYARRTQRGIFIALVVLVSLVFGRGWAIFTEEGVWIGEEPDQSVGIQREGGHLTFRDEQNTTTRTLSELLSSAPAWGSITGTLSNQTDLQNALNGKLGVTLTDPQDGQILVRQSGVWANYTPPSLGGGVWGSITGTLSNQTDLSSALSGKLGTGAQAADSALLGGQNGAYYLNPANLSAAVPKSKGGFGEDVSAATGVPTFVTGTLSWTTTLDDGYIPSGITRDTEWDTWAEHPALTSAYLVIGNASNQAAGVAMSGDITISNAGVTSIGNDKVTEADLKAVDTPNDEEYLTYESTTGDFEWQAIPDATTAVKGLASFSSSHFSVSSGAVSLASAVTLDTEHDTWAEQPALTSAYIVVGNGSNQPAAVAVSGDATIANTGAVTIGAQKVGVAKMYSSATSRVFGRISASAGAGEELTGANLMTIIGDAAANGSTKGVATFNSSHFTASSGNISLHSNVTLDTELSSYLALSGGTMTGTLAMAAQQISFTDPANDGNVQWIQKSASTYAGWKAKRVDANNGEYWFNSGAADNKPLAKFKFGAGGDSVRFEEAPTYFGKDDSTDDYIYVGGGSFLWNETSNYFQFNNTLYVTSGNIRSTTGEVEGIKGYFQEHYGYNGGWYQGMTATVSGSDLSNASTIVIVDGLIISAT